MEPLVSKIAALLVAASFLGAATAQDFSMPGSSPLDYSSAMSSLTSSQINNISLGNVAKGAGGKGGRRVTLSPLTAAIAPASTFRGVRMVAPGPAALGYRPNAAVRATAKRAFIDRFSKMNPASRPQLEKAVASVDFFSEFSRMLADDGYRRDNVADAMASCLIVSWIASKGKIVEPSAAGQRVIRSRIATALMADPRMKNEAFRQRLGDELQMITVLVGSGLGAAERSGKGAAYGAAMGGIFTGLTGMEPSRFALTAQGFVRA